MPNKTFSDLFIGPDDKDHPVQAGGNPYLAMLAKAIHALAQKLDADPDITAEDWVAVLESVEE